MESRKLGLDNFKKMSENIQEDEILAKLEGGNVPADFDWCHFWDGIRQYI
ncbi:hypothetical protein [Flavobacterium sp. 140616W15]|nr:hypothetical protein [Flavobacterium sp. 140616W15]